MQFSFNFEAFENSKRDKKEAINYLKGLNSYVNFEKLEKDLNNDNEAIFNHLKQANYSFSKPLTKLEKDQAQLKHDINYLKDNSLLNLASKSAKDALKWVLPDDLMDAVGNTANKLLDNENFYIDSHRQDKAKKALKEELRQDIKSGKKYEDLKDYQRAILSKEDDDKYIFGGFSKRGFEDEKRRIELSEKDKFTKEEKEFIEDDLGFFNTLFQNDKENIKEFKDKFKSENIISEQIIQAANTLKQFHEGELLQNIFASKEKKEEYKKDFLAQAYKIAELNGFDDVGLDKENRLYFIKEDEQGGEQKYLVNTGFTDNFLNTLYNAKGEIAGGVSGAIAGAKRGKNLKSKVLNSIIGGAVGSFAGASMDALISDIYLNRESNFNTNLKYALEAGLLSAAGDGVILGLSYGLKNGAKPLKRAYEASKDLMSRTPLGFLNTIPTQNIKAAENIINEVFTPQMKQELKEAKESMGGSVRSEDLKNPILNKIEQEFIKKYGKDDIKTQKISKLAEIFNQNSLKVKQQEMLDLIRSDKEGSTLAYLLEVAKDDIKIQSNLKNMLNLTTSNIKNNLAKLEINPYEIKQILDEFEQGNKNAFKEVENQISKLYDNNIKVILDREPYEKIKAEFMDNGVPLEEATPFLRDLENSVFAKEGVHFSKLNNFRKNLNYYIFNKDKSPNFINSVKKIAEDILKREIDKGIDNIFSQNEAAYESIKTLYSSALKDYATMKELNESLKRLKLQDSQKSVDEVVDSLIKFAKGQGEGGVNNLTKLKSYLGEDNQGFIEMQILNRIFKESVVENDRAKLSVFDSESFLNRIKELVGDESGTLNPSLQNSTATQANPKKPLFVSKEAKEFLELVEAFHKLYKNDASIAKNFTQGTSEKLRAGLATSAEGAIKQKVIKGVFDPIFRLMPEKILFGLFSKQIQGGALRYHLKKALSRSLNYEDFKIKLENEVKKTDFNSQTTELLDEFFKNLDKFNEEKENIIKANALKIQKEKEAEEARINALKAEQEAAFIAKVEEQGQDALSGSLKQGQTIAIKRLDDFTNAPAPSSLRSGTATEANTLNKESIKEFLEDLMPLSLPKEISPEEFLNLKDNFKNKQNYLNHIQKDPKRQKYLNLIEPTLNDPDIAFKKVENGVEKEKFIKKFSDGKEFYYLLATKDDKETILTAFKTNKINTILKEFEDADIIPTFIRQGSKDANTAGATDEIIPKKANGALQSKNTEKIYIKDNEEPLSVEYVVVKKEQVKPNFQHGKTQGRVGKQEDLIAKITKDFNPDLLVAKKGDLKNGNPIILSDGQVLAGNHRSEAIKALQGENLEKYQRAVKEHFNINLKDDEMLVRLVLDTDEAKIKRFAFASNEGLENTLSEQSLVLFAKYKNEIDKLKKSPLKFSSEDLHNQKNEVLQALGEKSLTKLEDTNKALFYSLLKGANANVVKALQELEKQNLQDLSRVLSMFYDNAGGFFNITHDIAMPKMNNLQNYLSDAFVKTARKNYTREEDFSKLSQDIESFLQNADKNTALSLNPNLIEDFKSQALGVGFSRFSRLENPNTHLFDFLKNLKATLEEKGQPDLFSTSNGTPLNTRDEWDFIEELILQGQDSKTKFELVNNLRNLREWDRENAPVPSLRSSTATEAIQNKKARKIKLNTKTKGYLDKLKMVDEKGFNEFVDKILSKDYEKAENILKIGELSKEVQENLKLEKANIFLLKKHLAHFRPERKAKYNQALRVEELKQIPQIIKENKQFFKDDKGFFTIFKDELNENKLNFLHFKGDGKGNFLITTKKADKRLFNHDLAGVEPATPLQNEVPFTKNKASSRKEENFNEENLNLVKQEGKESEANLNTSSKSSENTKEINILRVRVKNELKPFTDKAILNENDKSTAILTMQGIKEMLSSKAIMQSVKNGFSKESHIQAVKDIKNLFEKAIFKETQEPRHFKEHVKNYKIYESDFKDNAKAILSIQERKVGEDVIYFLKLEELRPNDLQQGSSNKLSKELKSKVDTQLNDQTLPSLDFRENSSTEKLNLVKQEVKSSENAKEIKSVNEEDLKEFTFQTGEPKGIKELRNELKEALEPYKNKEIINKHTHLKAYITSEELNKISSAKAVQKSVDNGFSRDEHFRVAEDLKNLFENAQLSQTHMDTKKRANIKEVYRFKKDILINDKEAEAKITVLEKIEGNNKIYTIELESLNKPAPLNASVLSKEAATQAQSVGTAHKEPTTIAKVEDEIITQKAPKTSDELEQIQKDKKASEEEDYAKRYEEYLQENEKYKLNFLHKLNLKFPGSELIRQTIIDTKKSIDKGINRLLPSELRVKIERKLNITPIKEFGFNFAEFYRDGERAVKKLLIEKQGQVAGAFYRKELGDIDLVWGESGSGKSDGWGLAKIIKYHPEVVDKLDELIQSLPIIKENDNRIQLGNENYKIAIRKDFEGVKSNWILTAFEKEDSIVRRRTDLPNSQSEAKKTTLADAKENSNTENLNLDYENLKAPKTSDELEQIQKEYGNTFNELLERYREIRLKRDIEDYKNGKASVSFYENEEEMLKASNRWIDEVKSGKRSIDDLKDSDTRKDYHIKKLHKKLEDLKLEYSYIENIPLQIRQAYAHIDKSDLLEAFNKTKYNNKEIKEVLEKMAKDRAEELVGKSTKFDYENQKYFILNDTEAINKIALDNPKKTKQAKEYLTSNRKNIENLANLNPIKEFGTNYAEFYRDGQGAVEKLLKENEVFKESGQKGEFKGQVAGAFYREELGDIDLVWGEVTDKIKHKGYGLAHILDKRKAEFLEEGLSEEQAQAKALNFIQKDLIELIEKGEIINKANEAVRLETPKFKLVLKQNWHGEPTQNKWIVTAYIKKEQGESISSTPFTKEDNLSLNSNEIIPKKDKNNNVLHSNTHLGAGLITGTLSGIKEDEEGNFSFNTQDFIKGFLGGASASLAVKKGFKIINENPKIKEALQEQIKQSLIKTKGDLAKAYPIFANLKPFKSVMSSENGLNAQARVALKALQKEQNNDFILEVKTRDTFKNLRTQIKKSLFKIKGQNIKNSKSGLKASLSSEGINKMISVKAVNKSLKNGFNKEEHFKAVENVKKLFEKGILIQSEKPNDNNKDIVFYHKFLTAFQINNKKASAKITLKETREAGNKIYSLEVLELEKS